MFENFKPQPADVAAAVSALLEKIGPRVPEGGDAVAVAAPTIYQNITSRPLAYLMYGPYWWAVKAILREAGFEVGDVTDPLVERAYGPDAMGGRLQVLVAATQFADYYRSNMLVGARDFQLTDGAPSYALFDTDVEALPS